MRRSPFLLILHECSLKNPLSSVSDRSITVCRFGVNRRRIQAIEQVLDRSDMLGRVDLRRPRSSTRCRRSPEGRPRRGNRVRSRTLLRPVRPRRTSRRLMSRRGGFDRGAVWGGGEQERRWGGSRTDQKEPSPHGPFPTPRLGTVSGSSRRHSDALGSSLPRSDPRHTMTDDRPRCKRPGPDETGTGTSRTRSPSPFRRGLQATLSPDAGPARTYR